MTDTPSTAEERLHAWVDRRPVYNGYDDFRTDVAALLSRVESLEEALALGLALRNEAFRATPVRDDTRDAHFALEQLRLLLATALRAGSPDE